MKETINIFNTKTTEEVAQYLLGMYLEHETATGVLGGYIVDAEAYLGPDDEAAHSFGLRKRHAYKPCMTNQARFIYILCTRI